MKSRWMTATATAVMILVTCQIIFRFQQLLEQRPTTLNFGTVTVASNNSLVPPVLSTDMMDVTPNQWHQWLTWNRHNVTQVSKIRNNTVYGDGGCGMSMQVEFGDSSSRNAFFKAAYAVNMSHFGAESHLREIKASHRAFFKAAYAANMSHFDAESHLREIKAYYLDKILGTRVVPPCVGHRFRYDDVPEEGQRVKIYNYMKCSINNTEGETETRPANFEGSMMLWYEGLKNLKNRGEGIIKAAQDIPENSNNNTQQRHESAVRYAVFHYLGACMKSGHNHFAFSDGQSFVAIDNDRCMTPYAIFSKSPERHFLRITQWRDLVYKICQFPKDLVDFIQQTTPGIVMENLQQTQQQQTNISDRLIKALRDDELSQELLESQPEAFQEINDRAYSLAEHMKRCQEKGGWWFE